jgi:hypothetical protein
MSSKFVTIVTTQIRRSLPQLGSYQLSSDSPGEIELVNYLIALNHFKLELLFVKLFWLDLYGIKLGGKHQ